MFLTFSEDKWPGKPDTSALEENVVHEIKAEFKKEAIPASTTLTIEMKTSLSKCFGLEHFSSSTKLFRVTADVMKFISKLNEKVKTRGIPRAP